MIYKQVYVYTTAANEYQECTLHLLIVLYTVIAVLQTAMND